MKAVKIRETDGPAGDWKNEGTCVLAGGGIDSGRLRLEDATGGIPGFGRGLFGSAEDNADVLGKTAGNEGAAIGGAD